jgi:hypothetical protein
LKPISGDWNGDGTATIGLCAPGHRDLLLPAVLMVLRVGRATPTAGTNRRRRPL